MKSRTILYAITFFIFFISCNKATQENRADNKSTQSVTEDQQQGNGNFQSTDSIPHATGAKQGSNPDWDKKIIKTATMKLEVSDLKNYSQAIHKTIKQYGGYIAQEEQNLFDERSEVTISIKVPVDQFESMMDQLSGTAVKILERKISTDDVTAEVVDTRSRLEAKKEMRLKYLEFLKQSKNMTEVLQVQAEINGIQEEIESAINRVNFLSQQASFSTINLTFFQPVVGYQPTSGEPGFFKRLTIAFKTGVHWCADIFVGLMSIWPLILVFIIALITWKRAKAARPVRQNA